MGADGFFENDWHGALNGRDFWKAWEGLRVEGVVQNAGAVTGKPHTHLTALFSRIVGPLRTCPRLRNH